MMAPSGSPREHVAAGITVVGFDPTDDRRVTGRFCGIGARIQAQTPGRIVPDIASVASRLSPSFAFHSYATARFLVAARDGVDAARCSMTINPRAPQDPEGTVGYIGHWECVDDDAVAHALLDAAVAWLVAAGCSKIVGPVDFSTWYGYRFTTGPWDSPSLAMEPYTPEHYLRQWQSYGFCTRRTYHTTVIADPASRLTSGRARLNDLLTEGYTFCHLRMSHFERVLRTMHEEALRTFSDSPDSAPIDWDEFRALYAGSEKAIDPRMVWFSLAPDRSIAGFAFGIPNHAPALRALKGRQSLTAKLHALTQIPRSDSVLFKTLAVSAEHRGKGMSVALAYRMWQSAIDLGYKQVYHVLMRESNTSLTNSEQSGTVPFRTYSLFEYTPASATT